ncbi:molybdopterin molybdotransferase MoeA [Donghicola mangrovi]|uniref:Molybdopterin molybdenumtransferase n=1 Tax=Donghicola mangrovi TaxID=2729614 RepID=A0A850Q6G4_9RHOB|nr:molybdopterin molybdotransferase MoeA [Donghicola mangrovi]NVO25347.1 molybdopterin molybdotransferase MoeA [Donghicola mangrovi]
MKDDFRNAGAKTNDRAGEMNRRCDCGCGGSKVLSLDEARARVAAVTVRTYGMERLPVGQALGRVLSEPLCAVQAVPAFDNAAMDGYAVSLDALKGTGPWQVRLTGRVPAGGRGARSNGGAVRIFTGAPIPEGTDAVIMQEEVHHAAGWITIVRRPAPGENVRRKGEEVEPGAEVLPAGLRMTPRALAAAVSVGHATVPVRKRLRVAVVTSGDELRPAGVVLSPGEITDVNGPLLAALMLRPDVHLVSHVCIEDTHAAHVAALAEAAARADLVITTGGLSVGGEDHMRAAIADLGGEITIPGVAVKPGKPVSLGHFGTAHWLGLPGNPMAAFVTFTLLGLPLIDRLAGAAPAPLQRLPLAAPVTHRPGRLEARPARRDRSGSQLILGDAVHSARMTPLIAADGLALIPAEVEALDEGDLVDFLPFPDGV